MKHPHRSIRNGKTTQQNRLGPWRHPAGAVTEAVPGRGEIPLLPDTEAAKPHSRDPHGVAGGEVQAVSRQGRVCGDTAGMSSQAEAAPSRAW